MVSGFKYLFVSGLLASAASLPAADSNNISARTFPGKRGLAYNDPAVLATFAKNGGPFSWCYNWAGRGGGAPSTEFVPMLWGRRAFGTWNRDAQASLASGSGHLLAFNEPDLPSQASMSPQDAARAYQEYMNPLSGRARLGSPAVTNGGGSLGLGWMENFLNACAGRCKVDFLAIHWYDDATRVESFKSHVNAAIALARKHGIGKIWVTEFAGRGNDAAQVAFLQNVLPWLDTNPGVERYAYFKTDTFVRGGMLSPVGRAYSTA
ncbi:hypothetical protein PABG_01703 [Paracoccidioides brasiliensis Pb03]|uniref:Asl1-like glycosyl hydrolase catalytic domain-containing protein n=1 Tax=Paracoccidioides brasiliensis (strain Pb18) TaxID=502780 RepID=C1G8W7_PARBD|nr:uncharacterized protein PADG_03703 [Paracoccidioides brasiliensis Pb18]EEH19384.1 hypothetical protein PABG_01703 [Paracoccidioides brasiliensis Pb03]EEH47619.1 hypothetical protein PADG_03703 [Paracoccidioides brasiliensis Pb18]